MFLMLPVVLLLSGCASSRTNREVRVLQAQVGQITEEIVRLDDALYSTRVALQEEQNRYSELKSEMGQSESRIHALKEEEKVIRGIYRTPSGFELPSIQIQEALKRAGYYRGELDGKIGPQTRQAIEAFQKDQGLEVDGVVGRDTWSKLKVYLQPIK